MPWAPELKLSSSTTPIFFPSRSTIRPVATGTSIRSRLTLTSRGCPSPGVRTLSSTLVPAGPLMRLVATSLPTPAIDLPFTDRMKSPRRTPASSAGDPSNTRSTFRPRRSSSTFIPTPSNSPLTDSLNCEASLGVR